MLKLKGLKRKLESLLNIGGGKLVIAHIMLLQRINGGSCLPLSYWLFSRKVIGRILFFRPEPLLPPCESLYSTAEDLEISELKRLLGDYELGGMALDAQTIKLLWTQLWQDRPQTILEFGAGVSTLVLATYASLCSAQTGTHHFIISIEQDLQFKADMEEKLLNRHLDKFVKLLHVPLNSQGFYDLNDLNLKALKASLGNRSIQWILIDGPSGPVGCRYETLPVVLNLCCYRARWFMDDAFRDGELQVLRKWRKLPGVMIEGIYPIGKGLATGRVL